MRLATVAKRGFLLLAAVQMTTFSYAPAVSAQALGAPYFGRDTWHAYFSGEDVSDCGWYNFLPTPSANYYGITADWETVDLTADTFIAAMHTRLFSSTDFDRARTAAIINMMMGINGTDSVYDGPSANRWENGVAYAQNPVNWDKWVNVVKTYEAEGRVNFNGQHVEYEPLDWLGAQECDGSYDASTRKPDTSLEILTGELINDKAVQFFDASGNLQFSLLKKCANIMGLNNLPLTVPPPLTYDLLPAVSVAQSVVAPGNSVTVTSNVTKSGEATSGMKDSAGAPGTDWQLSRFVYAPNETPPSGAGPYDSPSPAGTHYGHASTVVQSYNQADGNLAAATTYSKTFVDTGLSSLAPGSSVCYTTSVSTPTQQGAPLWRHSGMSCTTVSSSPYFAAVGGDMFGGGGFGEPCTGTGGITGSNVVTFGAFGEYGVGSTGLIKDVASAGTMTSPQNTSLTFANTPALGSYTASHCITNLITAYAAASSGASTWGGGNLNNDGVKNAGSDPLVINGQVIKKQYVIYAPGKTVKILGNIIYDTKGSQSFADAPSLIVIADAIQVSAAVTQMDGVYFASGKFNSCTEASDNPNTNKAAISVTGVCKNSLRVNGAVIAGEVILPRTNGGMAGGNPAETFVMRPDVFLTDYETNKVKSSITVDMMIELPPRY